ncbi:MAG: helix-turn-helix domain-containing protein [Eubacteriales bacterium]|nr:helix-turn-helix domain-containing protein [Eubacteriales bacterium]
MTVLIVDDQPDVVWGEKNGVNWAGLGIDRILTAYSVAEAEDELLAEPVDILLCDIEMPPRSGIELLSLIREHKLSARCIFLTAHAEFSYAQEAVRLGGFDYILQPAPYSEIEAAVRRAIDDIREKEPSRPEKVRKEAAEPSKEGAPEYAGYSAPAARAIEYIRQNINRELNRTEIAEAVYLNPEYLSRLFKKETGVTLYAFIAQEKMEQAKEMLRSTDIPVGLVALKTGYANFSYFSQVFKRYTGVSPLEYRKAAKGE